MPRLRNSILANYAGQAWIAIVGLAFVPVYLRELGSEGFGLVGFMLGLQSVSLLLDVGMGTFLNREVARRAHHTATRGTTRQLVRTLEWLIWPIATAIALGVWLGADSIATHWLNPEGIEQADTATAVRAIGAAVALLWPSSFYANVMMGLEQQPRLNLLAVVFNTLRYAGVVPLLYFTDVGILGFILWYALTGVLQTASYAVVSWHLMPASPRQPRFARDELRGARRFALGAFGTTALAMVITQADRFILGALRPLEELGYYTVALTLVAGAGRLMQPMFGAVYPRMSRLVAMGDTATLIELYRTATQLLAVIAAVVACVSIAYAKDIVFLWTGNHELAASIGLPLTILALGTAANGLVTMPYALQLAHGRTRIALLSNAVALALCLPLCIAAVQSHGMTGAASLWFLANVGFLLVTTPIAHWHIERSLLVSWYVRDVAPAAFGAGLVVFIANRLHPELQRDSAGVAWLIGTSLLATLAAALVSPKMRRAALQVIHGDR